MWEQLDRPPLDVRALRRALVDSPGAGWSRLDIVQETGSTNADLLAAAHDLPDRTVLIAEHQGNARGRHTRPWSAPARAHVSFSTLIRCPGIAPARLGWLPLATGVAVVQALRAVARVDAVLKWPNDVLIGGRKVAGILAEVAPGPVPTVVVGVGLNVSASEDELPVPTATSLVLERSDVVDRDILTRAMLRSLDDVVARWSDTGWDTDALALDYRSVCDTLGRRVKVLLPGDAERTGRAAEIDSDGRLVVETDDGPLAVSAGDVTHLRSID